MPRHKDKHSLLQMPSAWIPIAMSLTALVMTLGYVALFGIARNSQRDEGAAAHLFQFLMAGQVPIIIFFAVTWLPRKPKQALQVIALQIIAALVAFLLVFFLEL